MPKSKKKNPKTKKSSKKKVKAAKVLPMKTKLQEEADKHVENDHDRSIEFHIPEQLMYNCLNAGGFNLAEGREPVLHIRKWCNLFGNALYFMKKRIEMEKLGTDLKYVNGALSAMFDLLDILFSDMIEGKLVSRLVGPEGKKVKMSSAIYNILKTELYKKTPDDPDLKVQKV